MASIPEFQEIKGRIGSVTVGGRGPNSGGLTLYVDGTIGGIPAQASASTTCSKKPDDFSCYPWVYKGYLQAALAAQAQDREVMMLFYNIIDKHGVVHPVITQLILLT